MNAVPSVTHALGTHQPKNMSYILASTLLIIIATHLGYTTLATIGGVITALAALTYLAATIISRKADNL